MQKETAGAEFAEFGSVYKQLDENRLQSLICQTKRVVTQCFHSQFLHFSCDTYIEIQSGIGVLLAGKASPVLDPAYKGGALMDINLYNIHFAVGLFGAPEAVRYRANLHSNGVETTRQVVKVLEAARMDAQLGF